MAGTRERMVSAAAGLFRDQGYDGTGFREVVEAAGTTQGVIYHHFPGGKAELGVAVSDAVGERVAGAVEQVCATLPPGQAIPGLLDIIERSLIRGELRPGCPIVAIALAAEDEDGRLRAAGDAFFTRVRSAICECLKRDEIAADDAESFAALAVAACEGAVIMSRARRDREPFATVRKGLLDYLNHLGPGHEPSS